MKNAPAPTNLIQAVRGLIFEIGERRAREALGLSRPALDRLQAGRPIRAGSVAVVEAALAKLAPITGGPPREVARP